MQDEMYMRRCFELARKAGRNVKSNPNVGAVLVYEDRIIGEGYHEYYGGHHAEVNAINSVKEADREFIKGATIYVSLEPCCIHSKTPPCTDAIIRNGIKKVVMSVSDPNPSIDGKSIGILESNGITVVTDVLRQEGEDLLKPFSAQLNKKPYVILKWAQSSDGYIGKRGQQVWLSNKYIKKLSHQWRTQIDGILVGHNTALVDDPQLNVRLAEGPDPTRIVLTNDISALSNTKLYLDEAATIFAGKNIQDLSNSNNRFVSFDKEVDSYTTLLNLLYELGISRLMIEGGSKTLKAFVSAGLWDEARVISTPTALVSGIRAPMLSGRSFKTESILDNTIHYAYRL